MWDGEAAGHVISRLMVACHRCRGARVFTPQSAAHPGHRRTLHAQKRDRRAFLRDNPEYAAYIKQVRYRWVPGVG